MADGKWKRVNGMVDGNGSFAIYHLPFTIRREQGLTALLSTDPLTQERGRGVRGHEQVVGITACVLEHVRVNGVALIQVEPQTREILQPQVAIAVDVGISQP